MKKKIMYITQSNGGVARYLQMLIKNIDKKKYENILLYPNEFKNEERDFDGLVDNIEFIDIYRNISVKGDFRALIQINKLISKYNPDIIYVQSSKAGALGRIANIRFRKPIIYNPHGWAFNMKISSKKQYLFRFIERFLGNFCDVIIAISEKEKESALANKICSEDKIKLIFNVIDIEKYEEEAALEDDCRTELNISKESIVIGMVGRISRQKAPDIFIKSAAIIKEKLPEAYFLIVGDGEERKQIEELIEKYNLGSCTKITGWVNDSYKYIRGFDVAVLLSRWEGFGLAIAEYMVCEKPIIAANVDAIPNLIKNNETGILVSPDNEKEASEAVLKVIEDKKLAKYITNNANNEVRKNFDIRRVVKAHEEIIAKLIGK